jgi:hypothetical protein
MSILFKKELAELLEKEKPTGDVHHLLFLLLFLLTVYPNQIDSMLHLLRPRSVPKVSTFIGLIFTLFLVLMVQTTIAADLFVLKKTRKSLGVT